MTLDHIKKIKLTNFNLRNKLKENPYLKEKSKFTL